MAPDTEQHHRGCIIDQRSPVLHWWDSLLVIGAIYSTAWTPLAVVFQQARWSYHETTDAVLDVVFTFDMLIRFRTAYRDHGYDVINPQAIARHYVRGWFMIDLLSSLPINRIFAAWTTTEAVSSGGERMPRVAPLTLVDVLALLRIMRIGRLVRKLSEMTGANFLRIMYLMYLFVLFGHCKYT